MLLRCGGKLDFKAINVQSLNSNALMGVPLIYYNVFMPVHTCLRTSASNFYYFPAIQSYEAIPIVISPSWKLEKLKNPSSDIYYCTTPP